MSARRRRWLIGAGAALVLVAVAGVAVVRCPAGTRAARIGDRAGPGAAVLGDVERAIGPLDAQTRRLLGEARDLLQRARREDSPALAACVEAALQPVSAQRSDRRLTQQLADAVRRARQCFEERTEMAAIDALGLGPEAAGLFNGDEARFPQLVLAASRVHDPNLGDPPETGLRNVARTDGREPPLTGRLDERAFTKAMRRHQGLVDACYARRRREVPRLHGKVNVRMVVDPSGRIVKTTVTHNTTDDDGLAQCVRRVLRGLSAPRPAGGAAATVYAFLFQARE